MEEFISTTNYHELKSRSKKWFIIFLTLIFLEIILLSFLYYKQFSKLKYILNEIDNLESFIQTQQPILETKTKLMQDYESLQNKKNYLIGNTQLPKLILKKISKNIPSDCCLSNISFKNNVIILNGIAKTWSSLNNFLEAISKTEKLGTIKLKKSTKESQYLNFEIEFVRNK